MKRRSIGSVAISFQNIFFVKFLEFIGPRANSTASTFGQTIFTRAVLATLAAGAPRAKF